MWNDGLGMSLWNLLILDWTGVVPLCLGSLFPQGYLPGFVVAFLLICFWCDSIAKTIAFAILHKVKPMINDTKILVISGTMALFMVTFMSLYGLVYNGQSVTLSSYGRAWLTNVIMALPLNFSSWSHLTFYLGKLQKPLPGKEVVENFEDDDELPTIIYIELEFPVFILKAAT